MANNSIKKSEDITFKFDKTIEVWDEGIPLGNGEVGALLWGNGDYYRISLDKGDIWDTSLTPQDDIKGFNYPNLIDLKTRNKKRKMYSIFDEAYNLPAPTKLPVGRLAFNLGKGNITSELNITKAESTITCGKGEMRCIIHATAKVGMLTADFALEPTLQNPIFGIAKAGKKYRAKLSYATSSKLKYLKYPAPQKIEGAVAGSDKYFRKYFIQETAESFLYGIVVVIDKSGKNIAFYVGNSHEQNWVENATKRLMDALDKGYDKMRESHIAWWTEYWTKSNITLPNKYLEKQWYLNNYFLGSASKKGHYPMPLQCLWTADDDVNLPPWKGDYHHDLNTQLTYYSYLKSNRLEQGEVFLDYLTSLNDEAKKFAKTFYSADGMCLPAVMDIRGKALGGWNMYALSPTNFLWLCQSFERYYTHTGDNEFLTNVGYPYLEEAGKFMLSLLKEDKDGYLVLPLSSSPEYHDNTMKAFMLPNTNYDLALLKYIFTKLIELSKIMKVSTERWEKALNKLHPFALTDSGVLMLSREEKMEHSHRHFSIAMAIHPLKLLKYNCPENKKIIDATIADLLRLGSKEWVGYSFGWLAELLIVAKRGDEAEKYLEIFHKYFCLPNGFHCNGDYTRQGYAGADYRPFTIEGNFCATDALQEMLLYGEDGEIDVFPALPKSWTDASFDSFRTCGGLLVSASLVGGKIDNITIIATVDTEFKLINDLKGYVATNGKDIVGVIKLEKGEKLEIKISNKKEINK